MRGILTTMFSPEPDISTFRKGVMILSCTDKLGERVAKRAIEWMPHVEWTIVKRFEPGVAWFAGEMLFSCYADTAAKEWRFLNALRTRSFDVAVLACTNEPSYNALKFMGMFTRYRALAVFNENIDAYIPCKSNRRVVVQHIRWRLRQKKFFSGKHLILVAMSWMFLFPLATLYLLFRTLYLVTLKRIRTL